MVPTRPTEPRIVAHNALCAARAALYARCQP